MIKAILFDMDGVIIDSLKFHYNLHNAVLKKFGAKPLTFENFHRNYAGIYIGKNFEKDLEKKKIKTALKYYDSLPVRNISGKRLYPNVKELLKELKKKYKTALVTNTRKKLLIKLLNHFGLSKYFDALVAGDDVKNPKPYPDAILLACRKLKIKPRDVVYVGDNLQDIEAGRRAGCMTVAVLTTSNREELKHADKIIRKISELEGSIEK